MLGGAMKVLAAVITLTLFSPALLHAQGPERQPSPLADAVFTGWPVEAVMHDSSQPRLAGIGVAAPDAGPNYLETILATTFGVAVGAALGVGAGYLLTAGSEPVAIGSTMGMLALGGAAYGGWWGARFGNDGRGDSFYTGGAAVLGALGGGILGYLVGDARDSHLVGLAVAFPIAVALPATVELATTR
jgi:hypothetical protein